MAFVLVDSNGNQTTVGGVTYGPGNVDVDTNSASRYDPEFQPVVDYQDAMQDLAISSAKQTWEAQAKADEIAMNFSASEAQKLRDWQTEMSNTAYQRQVADMKKAGINPILAAANGGASTPSGGQGSGISSARQAPQLNLENVVATFKKLNAELEQSGLNAKTAYNAQMWASAISAVGNVVSALQMSGGSFGGSLIGNAWRYK